MEILGIDIGGSGIKGAIVDVEKGTLLTDRVRIKTPRPATVKGVTETVDQLCKKFSWKGPVGCGFPAVIQSGVVKTASNIHNQWIGIDVDRHFSNATGCAVKVLNDVDAAGLAEVYFGHGKNEEGTILMLTAGTGIGSALFYQQKLFPNTELGQMLMKKKKTAEEYAANSVRENKEWSWKKWATRYNKVLTEASKLFWPDLILLGGGVSKHFDQYGEYFDPHLPIKPAKLQNHAGIIGAAVSVVK